MAALSKEAFEENDSLVIFYTGLSNWEIFSVLYDYVVICRHVFHCHH